MDPANAERRTQQRQYARSHHKYDQYVETITAHQALYPIGNHTNSDRDATIPGNWRQKNQNAN
jgi:hypothetical protein